MLNKYSSWKYLLLIGVILVGLIYAAPNLFGEDPAVQVLPETGQSFSVENHTQIKDALKDANIPFKSIDQEGNVMLVRFSDPASQIKAKEAISQKLGESFIVALNLAPKTPGWLEVLGAKPMKLGLDLRGGVHFLIEVDVNTAINRRIEGMMTDIRGELRENKIRYGQVARFGDKGISIAFDDDMVMEKALVELQQRYPELDIAIKEEDGKEKIVCQLRTSTIQEIRNYTVEQTITTLQNRVNELGVAEAVVQRQGLNHVVVELPGIQDTARAKDILGKTATLEFHLYAKDDSVNATPGRAAPPGTKWYYDQEGHPALLMKRVILTGESITGAMVGTDENGKTGCASASWRCRFIVV